jgi:hypothetical protein
MVAVRLLVAIPAMALIVACAAQPMGSARDARGEALLAQALAGKVAGRPISCLPRYRNNEMEVIDRETILFRDGRTSYVQHTNGYCYPNGARGGYALVTHQYGGFGLCRGDIGQVFDTTSLTYRGSCSFNEFIPYRTP